MEAAPGSAAAHSARAEFVSSEQLFYLHQRTMASEWNRQMRVRVETAPNAVGVPRATVCSILIEQKIGDIAQTAAAEMGLDTPAAAAAADDGGEAAASGWTLALGGSALDPLCSAAQVGLLPQTTLTLVPAGSSNTPLRNDFSAARKAREKWAKRQSAHDARWQWTRERAQARAQEKEIEKRQRQARPRRHSAPNIHGERNSSKGLCFCIQPNEGFCFEPGVSASGFLGRYEEDERRRRYAALRLARVILYV